jgi:arylsulfatase A-like enzyme
MNGKNSETMRLIGRDAECGALAGLIAGVLEGFYKFKYPSFSALLTPGVSYVILFLGPLVDGVAGGLLGFAAGLFFASRRFWRYVTLVLGMSLVAVIVLSMARDPGKATIDLLGPHPTPFSIATRVGVILMGAGAFIVGRLLPFQTRRIVLVGAFTICLAAVGIYAVNPSVRRAATVTGAPVPSGKPNIILITLDTVRADHLSLYGYARRTTPSLEMWARKGVVFENAIAPSSWTLPSHASFFTGLLPHQHGADSFKPLDPSWWTLCDVLNARGYETAGFTSNLDYGGMGWGLGNGFELYDDDSGTLRHNLKGLLVGGAILQPLYAKFVRPEPMDRRDATNINQEVLRWFHHRSDRPFYLFINYYDVHDPYLVPAHRASPFGKVSPWEIARVKSMTDQEENRPIISADDQGRLVAGYDNCLAFLDASVGELLDSLSRLPGWENTIVIITSDHGEGFGEHDSYGHGCNLYRELLHVPLVILGPKVPADLRISSVVRLQELYETVLQFAGMEGPPFMRGGLQRFWTPGYQPGDWDEFVVSEVSGGTADPGPISLTTPEWQLIDDSQGNQELYHWVGDPGEKVNLAKSPDAFKTLRDLQSQLRLVETESFRPWFGPQYLPILPRTDRAAGDSPRLPVQLDSSPVNSSWIPIGAAQAFFPRRESTLKQPPSGDRELLRSLPYH